MVIHVTISPMYSSLITKPYLKQCRDKRQLCPATMVSQMPSREVHGSAMEEILPLFPWSTSGALQQLVPSSHPTSYSASPLHRAPRLQPGAQFYHSSLDSMDTKVGEREQVENRDLLTNSPIAPEQAYLVILVYFSSSLFAEDRAGVCSVCCLDKNLVLGCSPWASVE